MCPAVSNGITQVSFLGCPLGFSFGWSRVGSPQPSQSCAVELGKLSARVMSLECALQNKKLMRKYFSCIIIQLYSPRYPF